MARCGKAKSKCWDCTERKRNSYGILFCPHIQCIFGEDELNFYKEVGGATLIDPCDEKRRMIWQDT